MQIDWLSASRAERKILYRVVKSLIDATPLTWDRLYAAAFGHAFSTGAGYEDNFRAGKIDRRKATQLYRWISNHHSEYAARVDAEIAALHGRTGAPTWNALLRDHTDDDGRVEIAVLPSGPISIVTFADLEPLAGRTLKRAEPFVFRLSCPIAGQAVAFQWTRGQWFPLPLGYDGLSAVIQAGDHILPHDGRTGAPIPLSEDEHMGRHRFVFVVGNTDACARMTALTQGHVIPPAVLNDIASDLVGRARHTWRLYRIAVMFAD